MTPERPLNRDEHLDAPPPGQIASLGAELLQVHNDAARLFAHHLSRAPSVGAYLADRAITEESIAHWQLGYAPLAWNTALSTLHRFPSTTLVEAGLAIQHGSGRCFDRFRGRLMFPIQNSCARIVGFGGRTLHGATPKYLNSPGSALFHKGSILYGLSNAPPPARRLERLWVVEGYLDVITLWQQGLRNCVAALGTSMPTDQMVSLNHLARHVIFCFDGDAAGRNAAWRALLRSLPGLVPECRISFVFLPEGEDPDSLTRTQGVDALTGLLSRALSLPDFFSRRLGNLFDLRTIEGRARMLDCSAQLLSQMPEIRSRYEIAVAVSERARVTPELLEELAQKSICNRSHSTTGSPQGRCAPRYCR